MKLGEFAQSGARKIAVVSMLQAAGCATMAPAKEISQGPYDRVKVELQRSEVSLKWAKILLGKKECTAAAVQYGKGAAEFSFGQRNLPLGVIPDHINGKINELDLTLREVGSELTAACRR